MSKVCDFVPGDLSGNAQRLVTFFGLKSEDEVPVGSFAISSDDFESSITVEKGKYKSALFIWYLCQLVCDISEKARFTFAFTGDMRDMTFVYFGDDICNDAITNPESKHTTVQKLLTGENISIKIKKIND